MPTKLQMLQTIDRKLSGIVATTDRKAVLIRKINATLDHAISAMDAETDKHKWITTETGSHIKVDGDGNIVAGAGGKFNGKPLSSMGGTKKFTKYATNAERAESAKQQKHDKTIKRFGDVLAKQLKSDDITPEKADEHFNQALAHILQHSDSGYSQKDLISHIEKSGVDIDKIRRSKQQPAPEAKKTVKEKISFKWKINGVTKDGEASSYQPHNGFKIVQMHEHSKSSPMSKVVILDKNNNFVAYKSGKGTDGAIENAKALIDSGNAQHSEPGKQDVTEQVGYSEKKTTQAREMLNGMTTVSPDWKEKNAERGRLLAEKEAERVREFNKGREPSEQASNNLTNKENTSTLSSTSQSEAGNQEDKKMSAQTVSYPTNPNYDVANSDPDVEDITGMAEKIDYSQGIAETEQVGSATGESKMGAGKIIKKRPMPHLPEMATVQIDGGKNLNSKGEPSVMPYHFDSEQEAQKALDYYDNVYNTPEAKQQRDDKKQSEKQAEINKANEKKAKTAQKTEATKKENQTRVHLTGNTYDIKDELKSRFKAKWDNDAKKWNVPSEHEKAAKQFIADHEDNLAKKQAEKQESQQKQSHSIHRRLSEMSGSSANNRDIMERINRDNARNKLAQKEFMNPWDE